MDEHIEKSLMVLYTTLEQAEQSAYREGRVNDLIDICKIHLIAMHFYDDENDAMQSLSDVYAPKGEISDDKN